MPMPRPRRATSVSTCPVCFERISAGQLIMVHIASRRHAHKDCIPTGLKDVGVRRNRKAPGGW